MNYIEFGLRGTLLDGTLAYKMKIGLVKGGFSLTVAVHINNTLAQTKLTPNTILSKKPSNPLGPETQR